MREARSRVGDGGLEKELDQPANDELKPRDLTDRVGEAQMERDCRAYLSRPEKWHSF